MNHILQNMVKLVILALSHLVDLLVLLLAYKEIIYTHESYNVMLVLNNFSPVGNKQASLRLLQFDWLFEWVL